MCRVYASSARINARISIGSKKSGIRCNYTRDSRLNACRGSPVGRAEVFPSLPYSATNTTRNTQTHTHTRLLQTYYTWCAKIQYISCATRMYTSDTTRAFGFRTNKNHCALEDSRIVRCDRDHGNSLTEAKGRSIYQLLLLLLHTRVLNKKQIYADYTLLHTHTHRKKTRYKRIH